MTPHVGMARELIDEELTNSCVVYALLTSPQHLGDISDTGPIYWGLRADVHDLFPPRDRAVDRLGSGLELFIWIGQGGIVNDDSPPTTDDATKVAEARRAILDGMNALELAMWRQGFDAGFSAGWEAATKRLRDVIEKARGDQKENAPQPEVRVDFMLTARPLSPKAADIVLEIIQQQPGIRGVNIIRAAADIGRPLLERTTRTALYRMKREGRIRNLEGRWYAADAAPDVGDHNEGGENDAET
jgi:hypothetical protein